MTHRQCLATLLAAMGGPPATGSISPAARDHLATCWDCWQTAGILFESATGQSHPEAGRMEALFGCADVREQLFLLTEESQHPSIQHAEIGRHLAWCGGCRARLAEVLGVDELAVRGDLEPLFARLAPRWIEAVGTLHGVVRELAERTVVRIQDGLVALATLPEGVYSVPSPGMATRDASPDTDSATAGCDLELELPESRLAASLSLRGLEGQLVALALQLRGAEGHRFTVSLRGRRGPSSELLVLRTSYGDDPVDVGHVPPGDYLLEICEPEESRLFRIPLAVEMGRG